MDTDHSESNPENSSSVVRFLLSFAFSNHDDEEDQLQRPTAATAEEKAAIMHIDHATNPQLSVHGVIICTQIGDFTRYLEYST